VKQSTSRVSLAFVSIVNGSEVVEITEKLYNFSETCDQTTNVPHISLNNISSLLKHNQANFHKVLPKDVANHCGANFHEVKIFLLEKFVVHMSVSSSQANVHALQYVIISQRDVYYRYILCSVLVTDL
jgi:hypothetical protein